MITKALRRGSKFYDDTNIPWFQQLFARVERIPGSNRLFTRLISASDKEQFDDYLAEVIYTLLFIGVGFEVEIEPFGAKGPDLGVKRDGHQAVVEITRLRKIFAGPPEFNIYTSELQEYGNPQRDIRKAFEKILSKFRQVGNDSSIVAIWNDDGDLEEVAVEMAVKCLRYSSAQNTLTVPDGLQFIIYASQWVRLQSDYKQIYCFPMRTPVRHHHAVWQQELGSATVRHLIERAIMLN
jgi:hypothetical protein